MVDAFSSNGVEEEIMSQRDEALELVRFTQESLFEEIEKLESLTEEEVIRKLKIEMKENLIEEEEKLSKIRLKYVNWTLSKFWLAGVIIGWCFAFFCVWVDSPIIGFFIVPVIIFLFMTGGMIQLKVEHKLTGGNDVSEYANEHKYRSFDADREEFLRQLGALSPEASSTASDAIQSSKGFLVGLTESRVYTIAESAAHAIVGTSSMVIGVIGNTWNISMSVARAGLTVAKLLGHQASSKSPREYKKEL